MAYLDLVSELTGELAGLSPQLARKHINRAWRDIRQMRLWSFLRVDCGVVCPTQITAGTANITQFSDTVTLSAAASAALLPQTLVAAVPGILTLSIRFGASTPAIGQVYNIIDFDDSNPAAIVLTLNRIVMEATNATSGLQIYRPYLQPPVNDFLKWTAIIDMVNAFTMTEQNGRLSYTSEQFDARDPQRQAQGLSYYCGSYAGVYVADALSGLTVPQIANPGTNLYELWPHPTSGQTFYCRFQRRGVDFIQPTDTQPDVIPDLLILSRAKAEYSYPFMQANVQNLPSARGVGWQGLVQQARGTFKDELLLAKKNDSETALNTVYSRGHGLRDGYASWKGMTNFPIDANFIQSHLVNI